MEQSQGLDHGEKLRCGIKQFLEKTDTKATFDLTQFTKFWFLENLQTKKWFFRVFIVHDSSQNINIIKNQFCF